MSELRPDPAYQGDFTTDAGIREQYAVDASPYQLLPQAVAWPVSTEDCLHLLRFAERAGLAVTCRGAGTSLAGQTVGEGLVIDFSRYMNQILAIDVQQGLARVQPGVVWADLYQALSGSGLHFAPRPSTWQRCSIGGMFGNNAWGLNAVRDGTTRQHVIAVRGLLADGSEVAFPARADCPRSVGIQRHLWTLLSPHRAEIVAAYPTFRGIPNNAGYALDALLPQFDQADPDAGLDPVQLLAGSEGSLMLVSELTLRLIPEPVHRGMLCASFADIYAALEAVETLVTAGSSAVELLDHRVLELAARDSAQAANTFWLQGQPAAVLVIEVSGDSTRTVQHQARAIEDDLKLNQACSNMIAIAEQDIDRVWAVRRAGLEMIQQQPVQYRAATGIEDAAVKLSDLPRFARRIHQLLERHGIEAVNYGPVSMGGLHIRPLIERDSEYDRRQMMPLLEQMAATVQELGGSLSAKHGDGRLRSHLITASLGTQMPALMQQVKDLFDPDVRFNPGVKIPG